MTSAHSHRRKHVMVTDLDQSDTPPQPISVHDKQHSTPVEAPQRHSTARHKHRHAEKVLRTMSGNFSRRARSAECRLQAQKAVPEHLQASGGQENNHSNNIKVQSYFNELLQAKDQQMEKILRRLTTLHKFNEQFAQENDQLRADVDTLEQRIDALQRQVANCEQCRKLSQQLDKSTEQNSTLQADLDMLQTLVYRLNVQIENYQDRLRDAGLQSKADGNCVSSGDSGGGGDDSGGRTTSSQWKKTALHRHTLGPLLKAYDEMLRDKEQLLHQYRRDFEHFTGELKRVLEENNHLLQQQETLKRDVGGWREERTRLQAQLDVCRSKAEAQTRKSDLAKEQLVEVMHCYEQKTQTLLLDMEHLQSAYTRCKSELATLKSLTSQPQDAIAQSLQECKQLLEQLREQHSKEKHTLERTIAELSERQSGSESRTATLRGENTQLRTDLETAQVKAEETSRRCAMLQRNMDKVKKSRDRLKARLRIALQWAQKLEEGQANIQSTWDALKRLETIVKHKESQVRGLHARHVQEIDKMEKKLAQKEETIRTILKGKLDPAVVASTSGGGYGR